VTASQPTTEPRAAEIIDALAPLLAQQRRAWAARCQAQGLSMVGFQVLSLLEMHGALPMSRLAQEIGVALPNASGIVGRMAERGIVERTQDPADRRVVLIGLTDAGRRVIGDMEATRRARMTRLIGAMDESQQARLLQSVQDLHAAARRLQTQEDAGQ
jgi:DNA-binding MarR family transcriptional regulator